MAFLSFLFLFPEQAPMTSPKCRDGVIEPAKRSNSTLKILATSELVRSDGVPTELVSYAVKDQVGKMMYSMRGFVATGDICGDLEIYSYDQSNLEDPDLRKIWASYRFDPNYSPQFNDVFVYADILYRSHRYQAAAPFLD
jgi:hypothetical protein